MNSHPLVTYELWREPEGFSFFASENESARRLLGIAAIKVWSCTAATWEEALRLEAAYMGWPEDRDTTGASPT